MQIDVQYSLLKDMSAWTDTLSPLYGSVLSPFLNCRLSQDIFCFFGACFNPFSNNGWRKNLASWWKTLFSFTRSSTPILRIDADVFMLVIFPLDVLYAIIA